jgi:PKD repeat protein
MLTKEITLSYSLNIFSFEFTALNYRQSKRTGINTFWKDSKMNGLTPVSERKVSYTNLSPGEYTFKVIASNNDGLWNEEGASLK